MVVPSDRLPDKKDAAVKLLSWLIGFPLALIAITFAVINRHPVTVDVWPFPWEISVPLYLLVLGALAVGIVFGGIFTWLSAAPVRGRAVKESRRANAMAYQLDQLKEENATLHKTHQQALPPQ